MILAPCIASILKHTFLFTLQALRHLQGEEENAQKGMASQDVAQYIMDSSDISKDGKLSFDEFIRAAAVSSTVQSLLHGTLKALGKPIKQ